jgi:hypothetical protein
MTKPNASINAITAPNPDYPKEHDVLQEGLTKREYFAGRAMQGYISAGSNGMPEPDTIAKYATVAADALIKALNSQP